MSASRSLPRFEALDRFREHHPEFKSIENILILTERRFVEDYAPFFNGDERKARRVYQEAQQMQERAVLLWANIKDGVASPYMRDTLFNNVPESFIQHQQSIPGYDRLFDKLDFLECEHCRSIFGPAAYFVDVLRFIEKHIPQNQLPNGHSLESRHPRLYRMTLDCDNTHNLLPYIDLVVEVLEHIVRTGKSPNPYQLVEETIFPMELPQHLPLEELRLYLKQLKLRLEDIYRAFGRLAPDIAREVLALSPREYATIENPITEKSELDAFFGIDIATSGMGSIQDVAVFLEQTGLTRNQLNGLIFQDLSDVEIQSGLSRQFFVNNTGDKQGHMWIAQDLSAQGRGGNATYDALMNLTLPKLDRIYRFLKLSRKIGWSFAELDRALRSLALPYQAEKALYFDGVNDYVLIPDSGSLDHEAFTLEAWVHPDAPGTHPILCKGTPEGSFTQFLLWITAEGKLALYHYKLADGSIELANPDHPTPYPKKGDESLERDALHLSSYQAIPTGAFSHVAVSVNQQTALSVDDDHNPSTPKISRTFYQVSFYINGVLDSTWSLEQRIEVNAPTPAEGPLVMQLGRNLHDDYFRGSIKEVRLWDTIRDAASIVEDRYRRFDGREGNLVAYWPLLDAPYHELRDIAVNRDAQDNLLPNHHGVLGGNSHSAVPRWIQRDLILDPPPSPISTNGFSFNGEDQYLAGKNVQGLDLSTFTLEAWINRSERGPHTIICKGDAAGKSSHFELRLNANNRLELRSSSLNKNFTGETAIPMDTPVHVAAVVEVAKVFLYINGRLDNAIDSDKYAADLRSEEKNQLDFELDPQGEDLLIGKSFRGAFLTGILQEVRIWNTPRSAAQLDSHRHRQLIGNEPGLAGYWPLSETNPASGMAHDRSHHQNNLLAGGLPETHQPHLLGLPEVLLPDPVAEEARVLSFDEQHYQLILSNDLNRGLGTHEQFSLEFWVKADKPNARGRKQLLFSQGDAETGLSIYLWEGLVHAYGWCTDFAGKTLEQEFLVSSDASHPLQPNRWHHLTFTYDETVSGEAIGCRLYLDGVKQNEIADGFRVAQSGSAFLGGITAQTKTRFSDRKPAPGSHRFDGQITDLRLWKRTLTETEITTPADARHSRHIPAIEDADLICYLPMTEGYGRPVSDHAGPLYSRDDIDLDSLTLYDQSVNAHLGKLAVGPDPVAAKWTADHPPLYPARALKLNGTSDHLLLPDALRDALQDGPFTVEAWIKIDAFGGHYPILGIDGPQQSDSRNRSFSMVVTGEGHLEAGFGADQVRSQETLSAGEWHHVAWRYDAKARTQTLFLDGEALPEPKNNSMGFQGEERLFLGRWRQRNDPESSADHFFQGQVGELRLWDSARANEDISAHWQQRLSGQEERLLAYWQFDQDPRYVISDAGASGGRGLIESPADTDIDGKWLESDTPIDRPFALNLDGQDDYIDIADYQIGDRGTIELWVKFSRQRNQVLFDASNDDKSLDRHRKEKYFLLEVRDQKLVFRLEDDADHDIEGASIELNKLPPGFEEAWHHVAATWHFDQATRNTVTELFLDDLPKATDRKGRNGIRPVLKSLFLGINRGEYEAARNRPLQGQISQVRIWDGVVPQELLQARREVILGGNETGLLVYLPIYEGRGERLNNLAGDTISFLRVGVEDQPDRKWLNDAGLPATSSLVFLFDEDRVVLPDARTMGITGGDFTIEAWVNLSAARSENPVLGTRGPISSAAEEVLLFSISNSRPRAVINGRELLGETTLTPDTWHHVAWRYNATARQLDLLIDGNPDTQALTSLEPYRAARSLYLGYFKQADPETGEWREQHLAGMIADLRIWQEYRAAQDIVESMGRRLSGTEAGLAAYWAMTGENLGRCLDLTANRHPLSFALADGGSLNDNFVAAMPPIVTPRATPLLDGHNDYLDLLPTFSNAAWTIECWVRLEGAEERQVLFSKEGHFQAVFDDGCLQFEYRLAEQWNTWEEIFTVRAGTWIHIAVAYDPTDNHRLEVFLNGVSAGLQSRQLVNNGGLPLRFGAPPELSGRFFKGRLAEIRLWESALPAESISAHYQRLPTGREAGLLGFWPLEEGQAELLADRAENLSPGLLVSGLEDSSAKWIPTPPPIRDAQAALYFDGRDDQVALPDVHQLPFSNDFTVEAWVKIEDPGTDELLPVLGTKAPADALRDNKVLCLGVRGGRAYLSFYNNDFHSDLTLDDQWHHLAWQYEEATQTMRIVLDGQEVREESGHAPFSGDGNAYLGRLQDWFDAGETYKDHYFRGFIGEVRIWRTLRPLAEIAAEKNQRISGNAAGLSAYWIFDDQNNTRLYSAFGERDNPYYLTLSSREEALQPLWASVSDHPVLLNPLSRSALTFDGENQYLAAHMLDLPIQDDFTLEAWLRFENDRDSCVFWKGSPAGDTDLELRVNAAGQVSVYYRKNGEEDGDPLSELVAGPPLPAGKAAHVALVAKGDQLSLYIDGKENNKATLDAPIRHGGNRMVQVGNNPQGDLYRGHIRELRLWQVARSPNDLNAQRFHTLLDTTQLAGYWPLGSVETLQEGVFTPDRATDPHLLRLGGLPESRKPGFAQASPAPIAFFDARRKALTLTSSMPAEIDIPAFNPALYPNRSQRTVEVWFMSEDVLSDDRQSVYREGDGQQTLHAYLEKGLLHVEGYLSEAGERHPLVSERVASGRWHHLALVLDGRATARDNAFRALLDGRVIDTRPALQLFGAVSEFCVGGLSFTPHIEAPHLITTGEIAQDQITGNWHPYSGGGWSDHNKTKGKNALAFTHRLESGLYRLSLRYPREEDPLAPRQASNTPVEVNHIGGSTTLFLDQRDGGDFQELGVFELEKDVSTLIIRNTGTDGWVVFEALQMSRIHSAPHFHRTPVHMEPRALKGQVLEVRIWERALDDGRIRQQKYRIEPTTPPAELLFNWVCDQLPDPQPPGVEDYLAPINLGLFEPPINLLPGAISLTDLADMARLRERHELSLDRLTALWSTISYSGKADNRTLFDLVYNPLNLPAQDRWPFYPVVTPVWEINSGEASHQQIRTRLMSALRVTQKHLNEMVAEISGSEITSVPLSGQFLSDLYRLKLLSKTVDLGIPQLRRLMAILRLEGHSLNPITRFTLADVLRVEGRTDWMAESGIDIEEYDFLVYDVQDEQAAKPYDPAAVVALANGFRDQAADSLAGPLSLVSDEITEAASEKIFRHLSAAGMITALGAVGEDFSEFKDLSLIAEEMNWYQRQEVDGAEIKVTSFRGLMIPEATLLSAGIINDSGMVIAADPTAYSIAALTAMGAAGDPNPEREKIALVHDLLSRRQATQELIPQEVGGRLKDMRGGLASLILTALSGLLEAEKGLLELVYTHTDAKMSPAVFLSEMAGIRAGGDTAASPPMETLLYRLGKILSLLGQFTLSREEIENLLTQPGTFGIAAASLEKPAFADLDRLHRFRALKSTFRDSDNLLLKTLQADVDDEEALAALTGWKPFEIRTIADLMGIGNQYNTIPAMWRMAPAFQLGRILGGEMAYVIDLSQTDQPNFAYYERHARALFDILRANYDEDVWNSVYKPLHDVLAIRKRDSLTTVAMNNLAAHLPGRTSPDLLYEYLLIDVQMGSETETSRIVQGIAALQLYVTRCLMNLEKGVDPEQIPLDQWQWMKNYRVWEANRKVFLYPENYIEPELRDTKTPLFQKLEEELLQGEVNNDTVEAAFKHYLDKLTEVTNLDIVGAYYHTDNTDIRRTHALALKNEGLVAYVPQVISKRNPASGYQILGSVGELAHRIGFNFTLSMWVRHNHPAGAPAGGLLSAYTYTDRNIAPKNRQGMYLWILNGKFQFHLSTHDTRRDSVPGFSGQFTTMETQNTYKPNEWHHLAISYQSFATKIYVNGVLDREDRSRGGNVYHPAASIPFVLGALIDEDTGAGGFPLDGKIRGFQLWNQTRTQEEIARIRQLGLPNPSDPAPYDFLRIATVKEVKSDLPRDFTAEFWLKHDHENSPGEILNAASWMADHQKGWRIGVDQGRIKVLLSTEAGKNNVPGVDGWFTILQTGASYPAGTWMHVAVSYDGSALVIYVNGIEAARASRSGNIYYPAPATSFLMGAIENPVAKMTGAPLKGEIREVRLWKSARSQSDVFGTMHNGVKPDELGAMPADLASYWKMNDGPGDLGQDVSIIDYARAGTPNNLSFAGTDRIEWVKTEDTAVSEMSESEASSTLFLVGKRKQNQEFYLRELVNGVEWRPWQRIDLGISADFVSPVFAFGKLYLFWVDIQKTVVSESRRHIRTYGSTKVDQIGNVIDTSQQETVDNHSFVHDLHGTIMQIPVTKYKPVIKYSYYNFSKTWTQPQDFLDANKGDLRDLTATESLMPKWRRVYVQRSMEFIPENERALQPPPQTIDKVKVLTLESDSLLERTLPGFRMDELTLSVIVRARSRRASGSDDFYKSLSKPLEDEVFLFSYGRDQLTAILTHTVGAIAGRAEAFLAADRAVAALENSVAALASIVVHRRDPTVSLLADSELSAVSAAATAAADASSGQHRTLGLGSAAVADKAVLALRATPATLPATPPGTATARANAAATLAERLAETAENAATAAATAALISTDAQTDADAAKQEADAVRGFATEARTAAGLAATAEAKDPPDQPGANSQADIAEGKLGDALSHGVAALAGSKRALDLAQSREADNAKWERQSMSLALTLAGQRVDLGTLKENAWQHLALTLDRSGDAYRVKCYLEGAASGTAHTVLGSDLSPGQTLRIGDMRNDGGVQETLMSEFRLWNLVREVDDIRADVRVRKTGREIGLFHLPLDDQDGTATTNLVDSDLDLTRILPPFNPIAQRERIVMIYGDNIRSLRSNLEDKGLILRLENRHGSIRHYNISLSPTNAGTYLRIDQPGGIFVDHYTTNQKYPLDRYTPVEKNKVLIQPQSFPDRYFYDIYRSELSQVVNGQSRSNSLPPLLKGLVNNESYILDIHNHPGWFIFDGGDEQFLVMIQVDDKRARTAEERLRFTYDTQNESLEARPVSLYYERDHLLEVHPLRQLNFEFERLNTFAIQSLSDRLFSGGVKGLLTLSAQQTREPDFGQMKDSDLVIAPKNSDPAQSIDNSIDFKGAFGLYYREVFFHIPFLIANHLNSNQQFEQAQRWYHYIFDPTAQEPDFNPDGTLANFKDRYWRYREFRGLSQATLSEMLSDPAALAAYRRDPFDPHAIAGLRINAYQKAVVMKYIDNLLDWGDYLFRQDTREAINEAIPLYVLAFDLLGPRPKAKMVKRFEQVGNYQTVKSGNPGGIPEFLAQSGNGTAAAGRDTKVPFNPNSSIETRFCVIENEQFMGYWDRVEDRLYKIRHSLNIDGVFRSLALFQPPIEPAALVAAAAAGGAGGIAGAIAGLGAPVPHYRFSFMLEKAKELTGTVMSLGGALLDALEKKDGEALTALQHGHELRLLQDMTAIKELQIKEAEKSKAALEVSKGMAQLRQTHFERLLGKKSLEDANLPSVAQSLEDGQIDRLIAAIVFKDIGIVGHTVAGILAFVPEIDTGASGFGGSPVVQAHFDWHTGVSIAAGIMDIIADSLTMGAEIVGLEAGYARRKEEWTLEKLMAATEKEMIERQMEGAQFQIDMARRELAMHQRTISQQKEVGDFYKQKFTNQDLYNWMKNKISDLYFRAYQMAFDTAKLAEKAFQFEFGTSESHITFGHWDNRRQGLLAGESLLLDIQRLEKSALAQDSRYLEIEKTISLAELDPLAFLQLRDTGSCQFSLTELLFDRDYPGHYFRIIKSVSISIPAEPGLFQPGRMNLTASGKTSALAPGAYQAVKATLTQTGHKTLLAPDIGAVQYLMGESTDMPDTIRADWRANQQIAVSTGVLDSGMFELNFNDDRYLPFEGTGAVSNWHLEIPKATNPIDLNALPDVIIQLRYMCKIDGGKFKQDVMKQESFRAHRGVDLLSLATEFAQQWQTFRNSNTRQLDLTLPARTFPPNVAVDFDTFFVKGMFSLGVDGSLLEVRDLFDITLPEESDNPRVVTLVAQNRFDKAASANLLVLLGFEGKLKG